MRRKSNTEKREQKCVISCIALFSLESACFERSENRKWGENILPGVFFYVGLLMVERQFCAQLARDTADPFIGTATRADSWLLIEYTAVWERSEIESSHLPLHVKEWIEAIKRDATQTRFIKRPGRKNGDITVFFVVTLEQRQAIYRFQFARYEDILTLDLAALRAGARRYEPYRYHAPLFLVCTHGKHDACCAKFGMPVYHEFERLAGDQTWQSSHVGGDKFAANVICFPYGIYYGRVAVSEVSEIIAACNASQLYLKRFRGRSCYPSIVQAADCLLRGRTEQTDLRAFCLSSVQQTQDGQCWICFENRQDGTQHCLLLQERISEKPAYRTTCHPEGKNVVRSYRLSYYEMLESGHVQHDLVIHAC
jgi:hypothetical protein